MKKFAIALAFSALAAGAAIADPQGVTDDKITLGAYTDLSGPLAVWGVPEANGLLHRRHDHALPRRDVPRGDAYRRGKPTAHPDPLP